MLQAEWVAERVAVRHPVNRAACVIYKNVHEDANVILGALVDDEMENKISITVLASGFNEVKYRASSALLAASNLLNER